MIVLKYTVKSREWVYYKLQGLLYFLILEPNIALADFRQDDSSCYIYLFHSYVGEKGKQKQNQAAVYASSPSPQFKICQVKVFQIVAVDWVQTGLDLILLTGKDKCRVWESRWFVVLTNNFKIIQYNPEHVLMWFVPGMRPSSDLPVCIM